MLLRSITYYLARKLTALTRSDGQPNINDIWKYLKDINVLRLNCKNMGYEIARTLQPILSQIDTLTEPQIHSLVSKATTQDDIESPWFVYWCNQLKAAPIYHRKLWEFAFLLQVLHERGFLIPGTKGIGFGCGREPLASLFAAKGLNVTVSDLPPEMASGRGWQETGQYLEVKDQLFFPEIVDKGIFDRNVSVRFIDMNHIPEVSEKYDFCWSICAMEHLGSIEKGKKFVQNSLSVLKPGGVAVHTTEFNYLSEDETIDNWPTVLFRKKDIIDIATRTRRSGHEFIGPDFNVGSGILDKFIDIPPYAFGEGWLSMEQWGSANQSAHLKLAIDGFPSTCFGIVVIKND